tara:strand:- start:3003 stop:4625 length:1623 start_codon:yes stop_codon:yes gene_type:complete
MEDGRVAPPQVNYDNVLPLAIESRSNRREFLPVNGQTFSNSGGSNIVRIDVNADSMLDATHSYLECNVNNTNATANNFLALNGFGPSWIQRLRIESGGVVLEDINEYSRLYAMLLLNQCPKEYIKNNMALMGLYSVSKSAGLNPTASGATPPTAGVVEYATTGGMVGFVENAGSDPANNVMNGNVPSIDELHYSMSATGILSGIHTTSASGVGVAKAPTADGLANVQSTNRIQAGRSINQCIPLVSGWLNMDKYIPLVMMNAGFTIELTLCDNNRIGLTQTESASTTNNVFIDSSWSITGVRYVAHLIDLDRSFYDRLRMVMESSGGVLQLAGQSYRHFTGNMLAGESTSTITLPARVKSVKSIFGTFITNGQVGANSNYDTSVFQTGGITSFRFEIGSVRYPQTDVDCGTYKTDGTFNYRDPLSGAQREAELEKAFGKIGDYQHQKAYGPVNTINISSTRSGTDFNNATLSAFSIGYDFEAFQRVALEAGINTADRSLPINCIINRASGVNLALMKADFYVLCDAIFFINLDGTASVSY